MRKRSHVRAAMMAAAGMMLMVTGCRQASEPVNEVIVTESVLGSEMTGADTAVSETEGVSASETVGETIAGETDAMETTASTAAAAEDTDAASDYIGTAEAKKAALTDGGFTEDGVVYCNAWIVYDDDLPLYYIVEYAAGNTKYVYEIDLYDGSVLDAALEDYNSTNSSHPGNHHEDAHH